MPNGKVDKMAAGTGDYHDFLEGLEIRGIFLGGLEYEIRRPLVPSIGSDINMHSRETVEIGQAEDVLVAQMHYSVNVREEGVRKSFALVKVSFDVLLSHEAERVAEEHAERFADSLRHITWPYLREMLDSLSTRSGVPIPTAPLKIRKR